MKKNERSRSKAKEDKVGIAWKVFNYLTVFTAVIVLFLWLFQIVFMEEFYMTVQRNDVRKTAKSIVAGFDDTDIASYLQNQAYKYQVCIDLQTPNVFLEVHLFKDRNCPHSSLRSKPVDSKVISETESYVVIACPTDPSSQTNNSLCYVTTRQFTHNGVSYIMKIYDQIAPYSSTGGILRIQLGFITVILVIMSLITALVISKKVSKPIVSLNKSAKTLATGEYAVEFRADDYREISELADTLNYAAGELAKVDRLKSELIANISHDLRTPLTMISGYSEIIKDIPEENTPENIQVIIDETKRLSSLVNEILQVSQIQSGTEKLYIESFNLTDAVREVISRYNKLMEQQNYSIEFNYTDEAYVRADELRISQVIYNLLNNAITHTGDNKKVVVSQRILDGFVTISVEDFGPGISEDKLPLIWDRYYKADEPHKRAQQGSGLGLSIVKSIINMHNDISPGSAGCGVRSTIGQGSVFWFSLRLETDDSRDNKKPAQR